MPLNAPVLHTWGAFAPGYEPESWNGFLGDLAKVLTSHLSGTYNTFNYGNATPATEDQDKPWIRTNVDGSPDRDYVFFNGSWVAPHPVPASSSAYQLWVGTAVGIDTYDGGAAGAVTDTTGPMWQIITSIGGNDAQGRSPMFCGTLPSSQVIAVGTQYGSETHVLTTVEGANQGHTHLYGYQDWTNDDGYFFTTGNVAIPAATAHGIFGGGAYSSLSLTASNLTTLGPTGGAAAATAHQTTHPVIGVYLIGRTSRRFYVAA